MERYLTLKAPAKVNLFLNVLGERPDGYHEIETIFLAITLFDTISLIESQKEGICIECDEPCLPLDDDNMVYRAARTFSNYTHLSRGLVIKIKKRIPIGSGLGGGSSDAATTLVGLNKLWDTDLKREDLLAIARDLGADVPFFIFGGTAIGRGIGDELIPIKTPEINLVLITPKFSVSTAKVYDNLKFRLTKEALDIKIVSDCVKKGDLVGLASHLYNILEEVSLENYPYLLELKKRLVLEGALGSLMSGSGPAIFGLVPSRKEARRIKDQLMDINEPIHVVSSLRPFSNR